MKEKLLKKANELMKLMEFIVEGMEEAREHEVQFSIEADRAKDDMLTTHRELTMELAVDPSIAGAVDPRTGKTNKDWSQFLIDEKLERDSRYIQAAGKMYDTQEKLMRVRTKIVQDVELLNVYKTEARLVSAMLGAIGNE